MKIITSASGKIHLSGEHAVVYGKPAVLTAISKRLYVTIKEREALSVKQEATNNNQTDITEIKKKNDYLGKIIRLVEERYKTKFKDFSFTINSQIPVGAGLGSSAALAVATIAALREYLGKPWSVAEVNEMAFQAEKIQHGNPSGGDNTIVSFGGLLWFRKEFDFLKTFWLLPFKIPKSFNSFVLISTGRAETTGEMVNLVAKKPQKERNQTLQKIEQTTKNLVQAIHDEKEKEMKQAVADNEHLLEDLGVVSSTVKKLIREIESEGGIAKISGAGGIKKGSGIILALHKNQDILKNLAKKYELEFFQVKLGSEGVRREEVIV